MQNSVQKLGRNQRSQNVRHESVHVDRVLQKIRESPRLLGLPNMMGVRRGVERTGGEDRTGEYLSSRGITLRCFPLKVVKCDFYC
jgi:hypothetical protein